MSDRAVGKAPRRRRFDASRHLPSGRGGRPRDGPASGLPGPDFEPSFPVRAAATSRPAHPVGRVEGHRARRGRPGRVAPAIASVRWALGVVPVRGVVRPCARGGRRGASTVPSRASPRRVYQRSRGRGGHGPTPPVSPARDRSRGGGDTLRPGGPRRVRHLAPPPGTGNRRPTFSPLLIILFTVLCGAITGIGLSRTVAVGRPWLRTTASAWSVSRSS